MLPTFSWGFSSHGNIKHKEGREAIGEERPVVSSWLVRYTLLCCIWEKNFKAFMITCAPLLKKEVTVQMIMS